MQTPAEQRPWYRATMDTPCPTCGVAADNLCVGSRNPPQPRRSFHITRYERARELAGRPIKRDSSPTNI